MKLLVLLCTLLLAASVVRPQSNNCRLTSSYLDKGTDILTSTEEIASFSFRAKDKKIVKTFLHDESGARITVAAEIYGDIDKRVKRHIQLAIAFGEPGKLISDLFHYADSAVADAVYDKSDNWLSVSKTFDSASRVYRFRFSCVGQQK